MSQYLINNWIIVERISCLVSKKKMKEMVVITAYREI